MKTTNRAPRVDAGAETNAARAIRALWALPLAALCTALLGCPVGGDFVAATGGTSGTGVNNGPITAFGSIFVTEVEWDIDDAEIDFDGVPGSEGDLRLGMVVRVEGQISSDGTRGTATRVSFDDSVEGVIADDPVELTPGIEKSFSVLGLTVIAHASETTYDDGASFAGLARDQVVEVSGLLDGSAIRATRIELVDAVFMPGSSEGELHGPVENLVKNADGSGIFDIGDVTVWYTSSTEFDDLSRDELAEGIVVEAEGTLRSALELDADEIEREEEGLGLEDADDVKVRGYVSGFTSIDETFEVSGVTVDGSNAELDPSSLMLAAGIEVEVEGRLEGGVLIASEIESEDDGDDDDGDDAVQIEAEVTSVDAGARTLQMLGVTVRADGGTRLEDARDGDPQFRFEDIAAGDWLEIEGRAEGEASVLASEIEREEDDDDVVLLGPVTDLDPDLPALSILGQPIPIDASTKYLDRDDDTLSEEDFFDAIGLGDLVEAIDEDAIDGGALIEADEVSIED